MKKIAILICKNVSNKCTGSGCFKAFNQRKDAFEGYSDEIELSSFTHCSGCDEEAEELLEKKIQKWRDTGIDTVHLSTCIRGRCHLYETWAKQLSEDFNVIGYTHGSAEGKKGNNINLPKEC